ncbi:Fc receptor-like protein 5, partial [Silurus asotus]
ESPPVSLIISPSRTQHFTHDSLSLSCEDQSNSTGWTVRRYTDSEGVLDCSQWGSVTGSTCNISFLSTSYTGVYWCESESGENSNPVNITVHGESSCSVFTVKDKDKCFITEYSEHQEFLKGKSVIKDVDTHSAPCVNFQCPDSLILCCLYRPSVCIISSWKHKVVNVIFSVLDLDVILESSVHPVTEGHPLTLHCLYRNTNPSNLRADFYKDGSVVQNQTTGEMIIHKVSKSDEGFYHCKHPERGESPRSWISV